jgi:hypothetical protein
MQIQPQAWYFTTVLNDRGARTFWHVCGAVCLVVPSHVWSHSLPTCLAASEPVWRRPVVGAWFVDEKAPGSVPQGFTRVEDRGFEPLTS